jgi:small multidrug resistance pump
MPVALLLSLAIVTRGRRHRCPALHRRFTRLVPSAVVVAGYGVSFWLLALVLRQISIGTTYAVWSAAGTALIAAIGVLAFGEPADGVEGREPRPHHPRRRGAQPGRTLMARTDTRARLLDARGP